MQIGPGINRCRSQSGWNRCLRQLLLDVLGYLHGGFVLALGEGFRITVGGCLVAFVRYLGHMRVTQRLVLRTYR